MKIQDSPLRYSHELFSLKGRAFLASLPLREDTYSGVWGLLVIEIADISYQYVNGYLEIPITLWHAFFNV